MTEELHLFDPNLYGPGRKSYNRRPKPAEPAVEPLAAGWTYMRDRRGVVPYTHLIAARRPNGASVARCGVVGTTISDIGVNVMRRCRDCDLA